MLMHFLLVLIFCCSIWFRRWLFEHGHYSRRSSGRVQSWRCGFGTIRHKACAGLTVVWLSCGLLWCLLGGTSIVDRRRRHTTLAGIQFPSRWAKSQPLTRSEKKHYWLKNRQTRVRKPRLLERDKTERVDNDSSILGSADWSPLEHSKLANEINHWFTAKWPLFS